MSMLYVPARPGQIPLLGFNVAKLYNGAGWYWALLGRGSSPDSVFGSCRAEFGLMQAPLVPANRRLASRTLIVDLVIRAILLHMLLFVRFSFRFQDSLQAPRLSHSTCASSRRFKSDKLATVVVTAGRKRPIGPRTQSLPVGKTLLV